MERERLETIRATLEARAQQLDYEKQRIIPALKRYAELVEEELKVAEALSSTLQALRDLTAAEVAALRAQLAEAGDDTPTVPPTTPGPDAPSREPGATRGPHEGV